MSAFAMRFVALVLLVAALLPHHAHAQSTDIPPALQSMLDSTGIAVGGFCNAALNNYQVILVSGLDFTAQATLVLDCTGCENTTLTLDLPPMSVPTSLTTITAPTSCVVANRFCRLSMYVVVPLVPEGEPQQVLVSNFESTCGVVPPNDYTAGCSWVDFACQMTNGEWYHYGPALCIYLAFVFITLALAVAVLLVVEHNSRQFRLANVAKSLTGNAGLAAMTFIEGVNAQYQTNTLNPLQARPTGFYNKPSGTASTAATAKGGAAHSGMKYRNNAAAASKSNARPGEISVTGLLQSMNGAGQSNV